jgi:dihydropteroate synthase
MGVVNVTPDSFSDGALYLDPDAAIAQGRRLAEEGAAIIDVGGESTRPGAEPVAAEEELRRVLPVVRGLVGAWSSSDLERDDMAVMDSAASSTSKSPIVSIDTSKASVARAALDAGATLVNDVTALRGDPEMAAVVAQSDAECCLMHMQGEPRTMQHEPRYGDVVDDVRAFLEARMEFAVGEGIAEERVLLDPGIGFGKTLEHNLLLLRRLRELSELGRPLVVGTSRKSFIGRLLGDVPPPERLPGTIATCLLAYERGASVLRVHDVAPVRAALTVVAATLGAR